MRHRHRGFVLIASMLLLIVVTILALSMFRGVGFEGKIAGNTREKYRARLAAESGLQYAEWWLAQSNNTAVAVPCTGALNANIGQGSVCTNPLASQIASITGVPWLAAGAAVGTTYLPPGMTVSTAAGVNNYYQQPSFYIQLVGAAADGSGNVYRIDSFGYGGSPDAIAVVESTYEVGSGITDRSGL
jgi:type IV pilus assembly protein PilX